MKRWPSITLATVALALAAAAGLAQAQSDEKQLADTVRVQLQARDPESALRTLERLQAQRGAQAPDYGLLFLQGVTWQELAARGQGVDREKAAEQARKAYLQALELRPNVPAIYNNLGSLYQTTGQADAALEWYAKAFEAGGTRRGYYAMNYARALEPSDPKRALEVGRIALKSAPTDEELRALVGGLAARSGSDEAFLQFLAESSAAGHSKLVVTLALQDLQAPSTRSSTGKWPVVVVMADALARDSAALAQPAPPEWVEGLGRVAGDAEATRGAQGLARVLSGGMVEAQDLRWWGRERVAVLDRSRGSVMRGLLIAMAQQRTQKRPQDAERYLIAAIGLGEEGPDPDAFLRIVELYVNQGQAARLQPLMQRYEGELFTEKGAAYRRNDLLLIYRMHLALGMTYAYMNVWSSPSPFQNATFQLESAQRTAERFNEQAKRADRAQRLVLPAPAVVKLAEAYTRNGQAERATQLKLGAVESFAASQRKGDGAEVLQTINAEEVQRLKPVDQVKYKQLGARVVE